MAEEAIDTMFEDAVDALRLGDRVRAKNILTRLLKEDQNNPTYWIWMSAAVDTAKERIYCLETALKFQPENAIAKRGLVLLGGLPPDENIQPFPLNRPRAWEDDLLLAHEKPQETGVRAMMASPMTRLIGVGLIGALLCGLAVYGFRNLRTTQYFSPLAVRTLGPTPTFTLTPTFVNATGAAIPTRSGPTPLAELLGIHYTPTPLSINTPRSPLTGDMYRGAKAAYDQGDWNEYIRQMEQIQKAEPDAADVPYYIGEGYRFKGDCRSALNYYNESLQVDNKFAPGYVGLARARICIDPGANTSQLYDLAIQADPNYGETYLDRANFNLVRRDYKAALPDLKQAEKLLPDSALVQLGFAQAYLLGGDNALGLEAAKKANSIDQTLLPAYYFLGYGYSATEAYAEAIKPLKLYLTYQTEDGSAYALLGQAYAQTGDYASAKEPLKLSLKYDPNQVRSYIYLGTANLRTDDLAAAQDYFKKAIEFFPDSFDANIGLTETMYRQGTFGNAYLQAETAKSKAVDDTQVALAIYWRALSHEGRKDPANAIKDWKTLLAMPETAMTADMRQTAQEHLATLVPPTPTPKGGVKTPTPTATPKPSGSGTPTKTPTPTPTATKKP
jgi:tetratricopeptide (TPR) repeat protein